MRPVALVGLHQRRTLVIENFIGKTLSLEEGHF